MSETVVIAFAAMKWWNVECPVDIRTIHVSAAEKRTAHTISTPAL